MQLHRCFDWFVVNNHVNHQFKTSCEGSRMKNLKSRVLRRLLKTIQSEENSFQVLGVSRRKNDKKQEENARNHT